VGRLVDVARDEHIPRRRRQQSQRPVEQVGQFAALQRDLEVGGGGLPRLVRRRVIRIRLRRGEVAGLMAAPLSPA